jgi:hypothetical protein
MKKIVLVLVASTALFSCSKVGKNEFLITGTAKGIANGKTVVLEKQDEMAMKMVPVDTVKIQKGKIEIKGKITEPAIYTLDKDSIQNSKISGTYSNDEFFKFNKDLKIIQKKVQKEMMDFQTKNMQIMNDAQRNKDTASVNKLVKEYSKIQDKITSKYVAYAESHPKSYISILIVDGMFKQPNLDFEKAKKIFNSLDKSLQETKTGKEVKKNIANYKKNALAPAAPAPTASAAPAK